MLQRQKTTPHQRRVLFSKHRNPTCQGTPPPQSGSIIKNVKKTFFVRYFLKYLCLKGEAATKNHITTARFQPTAKNHTAGWRIR